MKFEADTIPIKKILWEKGYVENEIYELVTYQIVTLECGHKAKIKKNEYYNIPTTACMICEE